MSNEMEQLLLEQENNYQEIYRGTVLEGTVLIEKPDAYYVDLQYKTDGILPKSEVFDYEDIHVGDKIKIYVIKIDKNNGEIILSKKRVDEISAWEEIKKGDIISVKAIEINSKGLIVSYKGNIRGFIPLGHIELRYIGEDIAKSYIGKEFEVEILDVDPKKRRLILSRKAILQKSQEEKLKEISARIQQGETFKGIIKDIKDYGLFVDIGGIVGLVHISEISWDRHCKIKELFDLEQEVDVEVLSYDENEKRLSLSVKSLQSHPWDEYANTHKQGDIVQGEVKNIKDYGAFINLCPVVDGFVHISNLSENFVKNPSEILKVGDKVDVRIIGINPDEKKIELSMLLEPNSDSCDDAKDFNQQEQTQE